MIANQNRSFRPYEEARAFIQQLQLKNWEEWTEWAKSGARPDDIPANPILVYKNNGWKDFGD